MIVIAHRGASFDEPENSLAAFERAIGVGADYVEFDVQASCDGGLVVFHDLQLDRLTPATGPLRGRPLMELRELGIPTLAEVLVLTAGRIGVMAELKSPRLFRRHDIVWEQCGDLHAKQAPARLTNRTLYDLVGKIEIVGRRRGLPPGRKPER